MTKRISPGQTIGIIGAGQLGQMMALEAIAMGYRVHTFDPDEHAPARSCSSCHVVASFDDETALQRFSENCDVLTYEFENVNVRFIEHLSLIKPVPQGAKALYIAAHRSREQHFAQQCGIRVLPYHVVRTTEECLQALEQLGYPCILKTATLGYDGHGQKRFHRTADLESFTLDQEAIVQPLLDFDLEVSVVCVRDLQGVQTYTPFINHHIHGILSTSRTGADLGEALEKELCEYTKSLAKSLDYIGVLAAEYFIKDGIVYFNEMAPRPHNSGHLTIEGANISQFKAHIQAICGLSVNPLQQSNPFGMINILGQHLDKARRFMEAGMEPGWSYHEYGKVLAKTDRKMGHLTYGADDDQHVTHALALMQERIGRDE